MAALPAAQRAAAAADLGLVRSLSVPVPVAGRTAGVLQLVARGGPRGRLDEQLAIISKWWSTPAGSTFDHRGKHYTLGANPAASTIRACSPAPRSGRMGDHLQSQHGQEQMGSDERGVLSRRLSPRPPAVRSEDLV